MKAIAFLDLLRGNWWWLLIEILTAFECKIKFKIWLVIITFKFKTDTV